MSSYTISNRPADNYYLDYFLAMVGTVAQRYEDLLTDADRSFLRKIDRSSHRALRLLIRLYMRKGPNFIERKLDYAEIDDMSLAIQELITQNLIAVNPEVYAWELIDILPVSTSRELFLEENQKLKKNDLVDLWLDDEQLMTASEWGCPDAIICPLDYDSIRRLQLLYFGNERQTITDFILDDLGVAKYEAYPLDVKNRFFSNQVDIEQFLQISDFNNDFYLLQEAKDWTGLVQFAEACFKLNVSKQLQYRWHKLLNRIAYRLEQVEELDLALALFDTNDLPPSRERRVRILFKQEHFNSALILLNDMQTQPKANSEIAFYQRFINKVNKALELPTIKFIKPIWQEKYIIAHREDKSVELIASDYLEHCEWLENSLPMAVFGLSIWPIIFADVPGVWHHSFQSGPTDLLEEDFTIKRQVLINKMYQHDKAQLREIIIQTWQEKSGTSNPFINWKVLNLDTVLSCFDALSLEQWHGIYRHIFTDIRHHRSGFPDLFQRTLHGYEFIEIKGPGDKLQDNQIAWLKTFNKLNVNVSVCYVSYH
ncbi:VRR-NUC domain-containing protein [Reinekea sp.]|jgi:hypothetical protein|uniref:VRR-NUC domain-containing protein n=1 Tax=Reinekea sp. TaxID=1970455 RepID=UPI00398938D9